MNNSPFWLILCQSLSTVLDHWPLAIQALWIRMHFQVSTRSLLAQNTKPQKQDPKKIQPWKSPLWIVQKWWCHSLGIISLLFIHGWETSMRRKEPIQEFSVHEITASDLPFFFMQEFAKLWSIKSSFFFFFFLKIIFRRTNEEIHCEDWSIKFDS